MKKTISLCFLLIIYSIAFANVRLPKIFGDNMVLQRNKAIPIWGWADAGETITVQFHQQTKTAKAGKDGKWMIELDNEVAGGPYQLFIKGKKYGCLQQCNGRRSVGLQRAIEYGNAN